MLLRATSCPKTLAITGLIDWEMANILPAYFEYVAAQISPTHQPEWREVILDVLRSVLRHECGAELGKDSLSSAEIDKGQEMYVKTLAAWNAVSEVERTAFNFLSEAA